MDSATAAGLEPCICIDCGDKFEPAAPGEFTCPACVEFSFYACHPAD